MTLIYYYVPQDKDDPQIPNVFVLYENNIAWLDLPDSNAKLPTFKDKIMIKASRISWQNKRSISPEKKTVTSASSPTGIKVNNIPVKNVQKLNNNTASSLLNDFESLSKPQQVKTKSIINGSNDILSSPGLNYKKQQIKQAQQSQSFNLIDQIHQGHHKSQNDDSLL